MNIKRLALLIAYPVQIALAFDFTYTAPTQCDSLNISWSGMSSHLFDIFENSSSFHLPRIPLFACSFPLQSSVTYLGGQAPFSVLITPVRPNISTSPPFPTDSSFQFFYPAQNISIPEPAFNDANNSGTFSTQLTLPAGQRFLLTMSDATGFGSGGTSNVLSVGSSISGAKCNTTEPSVDFFFQLNDSLQQCRSVGMGSWLLFHLI